MKFLEEMRSPRGMGRGRENEQEARAEVELKRPESLKGDRELEKEEGESSRPMSEAEQAVGRRPWSRVTLSSREAEVLGRSGFPPSPTALGMSLVPVP